MNDQRPTLRVGGPMSLGELLDRTIQLCRKAWLPLLALGLLGALPSILRPSAAALSLIEPFLRAANIVSTPLNSNRSLLFLATNALFGFLAGGALILVASQAILGQPISLRDALKKAWQEFFAIWGTNILVGLGYLGVSILVRQIGRLIVSPYINLVIALGLFLLLNLIVSFRNQALLLEGLPGGSQPIRRSVALVRGRFWPTTGFFLLLTMGTILLSVGWGALVGLVIRPGTEDLIGGALSSLPQVLTTPVMTVGLTLLYYDTRIRLEGLDLVPSEPSA